RRAAAAELLTETISLKIESAVVVEGRAPQHRAVIHHAVMDVVHDLTVTKSARLLSDTQIAGIHETNELGRFVIEPRVRVRWIGGRFPKIFVPRQDVRLFFG